MRESERGEMAAGKQKVRRRWMAGITGGGPIGTFRNQDLGFTAFVH